MKILVLASQKGGAGKTTLAAHLAVAAEQAGAGPAVLLDTDPQGSLSAWWNSREDDTPALAAASLAELPAKLRALAKPTARLTVQAVAALSAHGAVAPAIVHDRVDYAASMVDGRTVGESDPKSRSAEEISQLLAFVQERMNAKKITKKKETV